jgi:phosphoglycerol transferase MdoB-like AlkP superfamily enzyme
MPLLFRSAPARLATVAFGVFFCLSLTSRLLLLFAARHDATWNLSLGGAFAWGLYFDAAAGIFAAIPGVLFGAVMPDRLLRSQFGQWLIRGWMVGFASLLMLITTAEWFFWDEFGARFNFIAVDYLIWTQEVLGNIGESYPMRPILTGIVLAGVAVTWGLHRAGILRWTTAGATAQRDRAGCVAGGCTLAALAFFGVSQSSMPNFTNQYHSELAKNGCWSFLAAFKQMELEYTKWYSELPNNDALAAAKKLLATPNESSTSAAHDDLRRTIEATGPEHRWNVILVCMESFSGSYMTYAGGTDGTTPNLDRLATQSLFFNNLYATGTRTVRGIEALTLNLPPTPGQAIIYRPEGTHLVTTFTPFQQRGYDCAFFYGGEGRFDYMNRYFSTAGCRIMDVRAWDKSDITFQTSWGACDEDLFNKTLANADKSYASGKPFHYFCMTTSNHRPFDFPGGRIDLPSHSGRKAAVKYSDWAIGELVAKASQRPWFKDTLFVFCADHCGSSAGKSDLNVTKYHIPAMIYNPHLIPARELSELCSQVDVMPTVFGLLNWNHETLGYGHDRLAAKPPPERAFISNYQKIALLRNDGLAILKPKRQSSLYHYDFTTNVLTPMASGTGDRLLHDTTAFYQSASWLFNSGKLKAPQSKPLARP